MQKNDWPIFISKVGQLELELELEWNSTLMCDTTC